jgi:hypothetical protein
MMHEAGAVARETGRRQVGPIPVIGASMSEKFRPGQVVRLCRSHYRTNSSGDYKIVRALPSEGNNELEYRVKGLLEPYERVVRESEIEKP